MRPGSTLNGGRFLAGLDPGSAHLLVEAVLEVRGYRCAALQRTTCSRRSEENGDCLWCRGAYSTMGIIRPRGLINVPKDKYDTHFACPDCSICPSEACLSPAFPGPAMLPFDKSSVSSKSIKEEAPFPWYWILVIILAFVLILIAVLLLIYCCLIRRGPKIVEVWEDETASVSDPSAERTQSHSPSHPEEPKDRRRKKAKSKHSKAIDRPSYVRIEELGPTVMDQDDPKDEKRRRKSMYSEEKEQPWPRSHSDPCQPPDDHTLNYNTNKSPQNPGQAGTQRPTDDYAYPPDPRQSQATAYTFRPDTKLNNWIPPEQDHGTEYTFRDDTQRNDWTTPGETQAQGTEYTFHHDTKLNNWIPPDKTQPQGTKYTFRQDTKLNDWTTPPKTQTQTQEDPTYTFRPITKNKNWKGPKAVSKYKQATERNWTNVDTPKETREDVSTYQLEHPPNWGVPQGLKEMSSKRDMSTYNVEPGPKWEAPQQPKEMSIYNVEPGPKWKAPQQPKEMSIYNVEPGPKWKAPQAPEDMSTYNVEPSPKWHVPKGEEPGPPTDMSTYKKGTERKWAPPQEQAPPQDRSIYKPNTGPKWAPPEEKQTERAVDQSTYKGKTKRKEWETPTEPSVYKEPTRRSWKAPLQTEETQPLPQPAETEEEAESASESGESEKVSMEPPQAYFELDSTHEQVSKHTLTNPFKDKTLAFKFAFSNSDLFRNDPVYCLLGPGEEEEVSILRIPGRTTKMERMVAYYMPVPPATKRGSIPVLFGTSDTKPKRIHVPLLHQTTASKKNKPTP